MSNSPSVKPAKKCYEHLGGKLGELLLESFIEKEWIAKNAPSDKHFYITELGEKEFAKMGLDLTKIKSETI
ncbi:ArsR family transcriptional regulator [Flavobacterium sp. 17A]|uniref:ArsR family transcriptional regulator n=1 Tax=Flavobacterium potami TaxID=2872310 RepID=A0A9X1KNW7_9FLAO|nr:ArsR family transcriptional regulator [Flavobacterium potami]MBZ4033487.1 ArsR family transcriptional regulator [Flavobacterium potami]